MATQDTPPRFTLAELATREGIELRGDPDLVITGIGTLARAQTHDLSFLANAAYANDLQSTAAGAVILHPKHVQDCPVNSLVAEDPHLAFARLARLFEQRSRHGTGIHETAVISDTASVAASASIGPHCVIGHKVIIGEGCQLGAGCVIGDGATLGADSQLIARVTLMDGTRLGQRVVIHAGAVIGADGFGLAHAGDHWEKVPQLGTVEIGDDCEIGANTTIDRGAIEDTILEEDVRIDNLVQVAHNVHIGAHTAIAACTGIAGSTRIGRNCMIGGGAGFSGHLSIADGVTVVANSTVFRSIKEPGGTWSSSIPARPIKSWQKTIARLYRLGKLEARLKQLERQSED